MSHELASSADPVAHWAERQDWIQPELERKAQRAVHAAFEGMGPAGSQVRSFLQGEGCTSRCTRRSQTFPWARGRPL